MASNQYAKKAVKRLAVRALRPLTGSMRPGAVAMLHAGRCGSTVLGDLLNHHPSIYWDSEIFTRHMVEESGVRRTDPTGRELLRRRMDYGLHRWYGFELKLHPDQNLSKAGWTMESFRDDCLTLGVTHFVLLERRNALRRLLSVLRAKDNGVYHAKEESAGSSTIRIPIDSVPLGTTTVTLLEYLDGMEACHQTWRRVLSGHPVLELSYEEHIEQDPRRAYEMVVQHIGLLPVPGQPQLRRTNPNPVRQQVENLEELAEALHGSEHSWMLKA